MEANIVCGFIAEFENTRDMTRVWTLNGYTLSKIIKALRKAGYNSVGKASEYD
jgi:molybdenum cofactor biosynthesis enzyme MoaA